MITTMIILKPVNIIKINDDQWWPMMIHNHDFPVSFMIMIMATYFVNDHDYDQYWHSESWGRAISGDQISSKIRFGKAGIQTWDL